MTNEIAKSQMIIHQCKQCNVSFHAYGKRNFCSRKCYHLYQKENAYILMEKLWEHNKNIGLLPPSRLGVKESNELRAKRSKIAKEKKIGYWMSGKKLSEKTKNKIREASLRNNNKPPIRKGSDNNLWKGGITPLNLTIRKSLEYICWRKKVFSRDLYTCVKCGITNCELHAHHIKSFSLYPELRFDVDNGITLCPDCHRLTDNYGVKNRHVKIAI